MGECAMPPKLITAAIIAFWLAMTGLLIQREVVPMMIANASPNFQPDLTDEIGSPLVTWMVFKDNDRIGAGTSRVTANNDGTFELRSNFRFDELAFGPVHLRSMENMYRVDAQGKLLAFSTKASANFGNKPGLGAPDVAGAIEGEVIDDMIEPRLSFLGIEHKLDKIHLTQEGSIVNPMHLVNRLRGLRPGMTWKVKRVDALDAVTKQFSALAKQQKIPDLIATVKADKMTWDRKEVACNVIEYHEIGKDVSARTWVRRIDGLVLQQEATFGFNLKLVRTAN
jgi:hypothetical protein